MVLAMGGVPAINRLVAFSLLQRYVEVAEPETGIPVSEPAPTQQRVSERITEHEYPWEEDFRAGAHD